MMPWLIIDRVQNTRFVCRRRFPLQLGVMLVYICFPKFTVRNFMNLGIFNKRWASTAFEVMWYVSWRSKPYNAMKPTDNVNVKVSMLKLMEMIYRNNKFIHYKVAKYQISWSRFDSKMYKWWINVLPLTWLSSVVMTLTACCSTISLVNGWLELQCSVTIWPNSLNASLISRTLTLEQTKTDI